MRRKLPPKRRSHAEAVREIAPSPAANAPHIPDFLREQVTPEQLGLIEAMLAFELESTGAPRFLVSQPLHARHAAIEKATGKRGEKGAIIYPAQVTAEQARVQYPLLCDQLRAELILQAERIVETIRACGFDPKELTHERFPCYFNHNTPVRQDFQIIDLTGWLGEALSYCLPEPQKAAGQSR